MNEQAVELSTGKLTYFSAGGGRPLLYLHPAGGVRRSKVLDGLSGSFALCVPVIPGFEGTAYHPISTRQGLAGLVSEFLETVVKEPCDVLGWSFGGAVALWLALDYPGRVRRLVLECPAGLVSIDAKIKRVNRAILEHYGAADGKDEALLERVASIGHRALILQGSDDRTIPAASAELLKGKLGNATLVTLVGAGHDLEMDQPERVLREVRDFLG